MQPCCSLRCLSESIPHLDSYSSSKFNTHLRPDHFVLVLDIAVAVAIASSTSVEAVVRRTRLG